MIPFLPLRVVIFAEESQTLLTAIDPIEYAGFFPSPALNIQFQRWRNDLLSIFDELREAH